MSEKMPEDVSKLSVEGSEEYLEGQRTITEADLLKEGSRYVIVREENGKREKRLELTEKQIEQSRHEMMKSLERKAKLNEFLEKIGVKPDEFEMAPMYDITSSLKDSSYEHKDKGCLGCMFLTGKSERPKMLKALYEKHPDLKSQVFIWGGDMGRVIVHGNQMDFIDAWLYRDASKG